jgi:P-type Cu+ transporter
MNTGLTDSTTEETRLSIMGMSCAGCVSTVEGALAAVPGVVSVSVNFADHSAMVRYCVRL